MESGAGAGSVEIGIIGTGLIGASLVEALKACGAARRIHVLEPSIDHLSAVRERHPDLAVAGDVEALSGCDFVFVCSPPHAVAGYVLSLSGARSVVIDVASVKASIVAAVAAGGGNPRFVPGHPLSGGTSSGPAEACADIITRRPFVLCPTEQTDAAALHEAEVLLRRIGAATTIVEADAHDRIMALLSHVPHLIAFSLVEQLAALPEAERAVALQLMPNSFASVTHFALSDPVMWADIFAQNKAAIAAAADQLDRSNKALLAGGPELLQGLRTLREGLKSG